MEILGKHVGNFVKQQSGKNFMFIRHGECMANYSGVLAGFMDSKLTVKGREQSNSLYGQLYPHIDKFDKIFASDLERATDTAELALGFPDKNLVLINPILRELNFGKEENTHYDSMSQEKKDWINDISYQAEGGESWNDVRERVVKFMGEQPEGNYLVFSHGGLMCSLTWYIGCQDCLPNCSSVGIKAQQDGTPEELVFKFEYPQVEEL